MRTGQREYRGDADKEAMISLAHASPADNLHVVDLPYRLSSWALDDPDNIGLWVNAGGQLLAWAVMQTPFWTVDYVCHPRAKPDLHRQVLIWADHRARQVLGGASGRPSWFVMVFASHANRIHDLEDAGFASQAGVEEDAWSKVLLQRSCRIPVAACALPEGFVIRPLAGEREMEAYVRLHRAAFKSENMTVEWRARMLGCPDYQSALDLVAAAPDGRLAAFCVCWLDRHEEGIPEGQVEPMGVHEDFRRLGLGRAILAEGLRRLKLHGAGGVRVETDNYRDAAMGLYEAMGFRVAQDVLVFRKDYEGVPDQEDPGAIA